MHRKEHEKFGAGDAMMNARDVKSHAGGRTLSAGDERSAGAGLCSDRKSYSSWALRLCLFSTLLLLTLLSGCGRKKPAGANAETSGGSMSQVESTKDATEALLADLDFEDLDEDEKEQLLKTLVQDSYTFEGEVSDGPADRTEVSYHVPKICSDSVGAKEINQAIAQACEDVTSQKADEYVGWIEVDYDSYLNGDTLSLVLTKSSNLDDYTEYYAYNLNLTDGTRMSAKELAKLLVRGVPTEDDDDEAPPTLELQGGETAEAALLRVIRRATAYEFDQSVRYMYDSDFYSSASEDERQSIYAEFMKYRMQTLADDNITADLPMYLDDDGELVVAVPLHVMAGGGLYSTELRPMQTIYQYDAASDRVLSGKDWADKLEDAREAGETLDAMNAERRDLNLSFDDAVFINYEDGRMTVRIEQNDWTEAAFGVGSIEYGKEYEVDGVYKDYASAELLTIMHGEHVVPTFVSTDGMIAYLDLYHGAWGGHFCLTEPAYGIMNIEAIAEGNASAIATALETNMFGQSDTFARDVMGLYESEGCTTETSFDTDAGTSYTDTFYLGFDLNDPSTFLYQDACVDAGISLDFEGRCSWLGMNGQVPALQAGQAIYLKLSFPGDSPHHGISYVDAAGTTHYLSMMQSGFDGSLALSEEKAFT